VQELFAFLISGAIMSRLLLHRYIAEIRNLPSWWIASGDSAVTCRAGPDYWQKRGRVGSLYLLNRTLDLYI